MTEYRLKPSLDFNKLYWLQSRRVIFSIPLWWVNVECSSAEGCWEAMDSIRSPKQIEYIYEEDRE